MTRIQEKIIPPTRTQRLTEALLDCKRGGQLATANIDELLAIVQEAGKKTENGKKKPK